MDQLASDIRLGTIMARIDSALDRGDRLAFFHASLQWKQVQLELAGYAPVPARHAAR